MKSRIGLFIAIVCFLFMFSACSFDNKNEQKEKSGSVVLAENFSTLKELKDRSPDIVEVNIIDTTESIEYGGATFTISKANVISKIKGKFKKGDEIKILEPGANINGDLMNKGDNYFLCIEKYVGPIVKDAFVIIGLYQGKFKIENDDVIQQAPDEHKLKDYKPMGKEKFRKLIDEQN